MLAEYVQDTVKLIVDHPENVSVNKIESSRSIVIEVKVHKDDRGKVIGRKGATIIALRVLLSAMKKTQHKDNRRVILELVE